MHREQRFPVLIITLMHRNYRYLNGSIPNASWLRNPTLHISFMTMDKEFRLYVICFRCGAFETAFDMMSIDWECGKCMK